MSSTWSGQSILNVLVPIAPVILSPWAKLPHYFPKPVFHTSFRSGSFAKRLYDVMSLPVFGCITGAQKCWMFSWEWISFDVLVMKSWLSFMRGHIFSIPTADNEKRKHNSKTSLRCIGTHTPNRTSRKGSPETIIPNNKNNQPGRFYCIFFGRGRDQKNSPPS